MPWPADAHDTEWRLTLGSVAAPAGRVASTPAVHVSALSVSSRPCWWPELSAYQPTALQLPADGHDTELRLTPGSVAAPAGRVASTPAAHTPPPSASSTPWGPPAPSPAPPRAPPA